MYFIIFIIAITLIICFIQFLILNNQYKVIESNRFGSKWRLIIVNKYGTCYEWILSTNSEYGQRLESGTFGNGSILSKWSLHGNYKGFVELEKNTDLWDT